MGTQQQGLELSASTFQSRAVHRGVSRHCYRAQARGPHVTICTDQLLTCSHELMGRHQAKAFSVGWGMGFHQLF